jgi:hypothetical protein
VSGFADGNALLDAIRNLAHIVRVKEPDEPSNVRPVSCGDGSLLDLLSHAVQLVSAALWLLV